MSPAAAGGVDVLVFGAHPDDAEIGVGGLLLRLADLGRSAVLVDCTRGETASRGTPEERAVEAGRAAEMLGGVPRENLGLPDGGLVDDADTVAMLVGVLRRHRPGLLLGPHPVDAHPDHEALARACRRAFFHAGLKKFRPDLGPPHRPRLLLRYAGNDHGTPGFCIDISPVLERKRELLECYGSQIGRGPDGRAHYLRGTDHVERALTRDRYYGMLVGREAAEPLWTDGPFALDALHPITELLP